MDPKHTTCFSLRHKHETILYHTLELCHRICEIWQVTLVQWLESPNPWTLWPSTHLKRAKAGTVDACKIRVTLGLKLICSSASTISWRKCATKTSLVCIQSTWKRCHFRRIRQWTALKVSFKRCNVTRNNYCDVDLCSIQIVCCILLFYFFNANKGYIGRPKEMERLFKLQTYEGAATNYE